MKRKINDIDADALAVYEPVNSKFRVNMFMKWRMEEKEHNQCENGRKGRNHNHGARRSQQIPQPWQ